MNYNKLVSEIEFWLEINSLRDIGLDNEEIEGFIDMFVCNFVDKITIDKMRVNDG